MHSSTHRTLLAIAVLVLSVAMLIRALPEARGHGLGPSVMGGEAPWVSFSGTRGSSGTVYTVPSDQAFVMTGACVYSDDGSARYVDIYEGSTLKVHRYSGAGNYCGEWADNFLGEGNAHIVFEPGSTVRVVRSSGTIYYAIQGYLAHP